MLKRPTTNVKLKTNIVPKHSTLQKHGTVIPTSTNKTKPGSSSVKPAVPLIPKDVPEATTSTVHVDLYKWPFKRDHKGVILREDWNRLVGRIQKSGNNEFEKENAELHVQLQNVLNERDNMIAKFKEMASDVSKFCRHHHAKYGE